MYFVLGICMWAVLEMMRMGPMMGRRLRIELWEKASILRVERKASEKHENGRRNGRIVLRKPKERLDFKEGMIKIFKFCEESK